MKGSLQVTQGKSVESIIRAKNRELRAEREKVQALEITNTIISAYLSLLVEKVGSVRISKKAVSLALGNFITNARAEGDDYIITVERSTNESGLGVSGTEDGISEERVADALEENDLKGDCGE